MIRVNKYSEKGQTEEHKRVSFLPENLGEAMLIKRMLAKRKCKENSVPYDNVSVNGDDPTLRADLDYYLARGQAPILRFKFNAKTEGNYDVYSPSEDDLKKMTGATKERLEAKIDYSPETLANE